MLTNAFNKLSVTRKMVTIMVMASTVAVLIASASFGVSEAVTYRTNVGTNVATLGDVVGTNTTAALLFEDTGLAEQVLESFAADENIIHARVFYTDAQVLASYPSDLELGEANEAVIELVRSAAKTGEPVEHFSGIQFIDAVRPVYFDSELVGFIYLRSSLNEVVATIQRIAMLAVITVLAAIFVAWFVSTKLHNVISSPILQMSELMKRVTSEQDYSLRATTAGQDEIGSLMSGFNDMLEQISTRDLQLAETNEKLKKAIRESLHAKHAAESASRAKSDFLARMSHEIRTPMNGVLGMSELLLSSNLSDNDRKFAETIQQSGEALLAVINDILDFSKIEAGHLELEEQDFDLTDILEGIVDLLYNRSHEKGVELIAHISPDIPTHVFGDGTRLRQVLMNLIGNAVKFTEEGEIVVRLSAVDGEKGRMLYRFEVQDTGIGIAADKGDVIFESFAQADVSTTRQYGGTGLGLAISKQLIELMGGKIGVTSTVGEGSTFWFTVPMPVVRNKARPQSALIDDSLAGVRVLIVDDNETNCHIFEEQLAAWQVETETARSVDAAVETLDRRAAKGEYFNLILLDFLMPEKNGLRLAEAVRARDDLGSPGLLMLSSAGSDYATEEVKAAGVDLHLSKPVRRATLHDALIRVLSEGQADNNKKSTKKAAQQEALPQFGLNILLVEDIPINMQVALQMLKGLGCQVATAENGQQALDAIAAEPPDLVLMDCQMPIMDGYTATREQRKREEIMGGHVTIVALTANALSEDRQKCIDAGMDDFISKPFKREELIETLGRWCESESTGKVVEMSSEPEKPTDEPVIDSHALDQIAQLDPDSGDELVCSIIDSYIDTADSLIRDLESAGNSQDADGVVRAAHALKSSSANVGATRLAGLCSRIEAEARQGNIESIVADMAEAANEYDAVSAELSNTRKERAA